MERRHRLRAVRNLTAAAVLLAVFWWLHSSPLPTVEMELCRDERQHLAERSRIIFSCESEDEGMTLVGVTERAVHTCSRLRSLIVWPKNPVGATLVSLPSRLEYKDETAAGLVAVNPPVLAEQAKLTMQLTDYEDMTVISEGERQGEVFLFRMEGTYDILSPLFDIGHSNELPPYTLEFFGGDGALLETVTNMT